ncbi:hypothetical protein AMTR_s00010p00266830 [Amborella trichopoda]|uniref:Uncharacterized protein n=1 Tax=Amborella trichopoda TaxID=13333 RepID=W1NH77_AMBTC|nr:hypothetical protein AMTR_s00010p00266830 [Amborella trichopoda]
MYLEPHHHKNHFKAKKPTKKHHDLHFEDTPSAPLNTTSYIIRAKNCEITPLVCSPSPIFDSYGSMKGLLKVREAGKGTSEAEGLKQIEEKVEKRLLFDEDVDAGRLELLSSWPNSSCLGPRILAIRIRDQDDQIAHLEAECVMLKERMVCMEDELVRLKRRTRVLELGAEVRLLDVCSGGEASFA